MTFSLKNKGLIALDLDGTVTEGKNPPSEAVKFALESYQKDNWKIAFITGRSFKWVKTLLKDLSFPYFLAVQNGALGLTQPEEKLFFKHYLDTEAFRKADLLKVPYALYSGDKDDTVYWQPDNYPQRLQTYLKDRIRAYDENWVVSKTLPLEAAALKWFGGKEEMEKLSKILQKEGFQCTPIRDPYNPEIYIAQATHSKANKGEALKSFKQGIEGISIAAGDDLNDLSLLKAADISIAMEKSPEILKNYAQLIAHEGLIDALKKACS